MYTPRNTRSTGKTADSEISDGRGSKISDPTPQKYSTGRQDRPPPKKPTPRQAGKSRKFQTPKKSIYIEDIYKDIYLEGETRAGGALKNQVGKTTTGRNSNHQTKNRPPESKTAIRARARGDNTKATPQAIQQQHQERESTIQSQYANRRANTRRKNARNRILSDYLKT